MSSGCVTGDDPEVALLASFTGLIRQLRHRRVPGASSAYGAEQDEGVGSVCLVRLCFL